MRSFVPHIPIMHHFCKFGEKRVNKVTGVFVCDYINLIDWGGGLDVVTHGRMSRTALA